MSKYSFQIILLFATACSSQSQNTAFNKQAVKFNNKAIEFIQIEQLDSALYYLNEATKIDSTYYAAYGNKASIYISLKDYQSALLEIQKQVRAKPDLAEAWTLAGMLSDKLDDSSRALKYYGKSIEIFDDRILNPEKKKDVYANKLNRAVALILIGQDHLGRDELRKLKEASPNDEQLDDLLKFSKKDYLNQIFHD